MIQSFLRCWALPATLCLSVSVATPLAVSAVDHDPAVLAAARLANDIYQRHLEALRQDLEGEDAALRLLAIERLARTNDPNVVPLLMPYLSTTRHSTEVVSATILALTGMGANIATELRQLARRPELEAVAYNGLARLERWGAEDWRSRATIGDDALRASAVTNLGNDSAHAAAEILAEAMLHDRDPHIRRMATIGLGKLGDPSYGPQLARALTDANPVVRRYAAEALASMNYTDAIPNILMAMQSNVAANHLNRALVQLSGEDFGFDHRANLPSRQEAIERAFVWYTAQQQ